MAAAGLPTTYRGIQALRFVAAMLVVLSHTIAMAFDRHLFGGVPRWINGHSGVDIFFVISGFVMYLSCGAAGTGDAAWKLFALRRVARIVPLYWTMTTLKLLILVAAPWAAVNSALSLRHILASYLFLPHLFPDGVSVPVLPVGWTLNFEMFFYAVCAAALLFRRNALSVAGPALVCLVLIGVLFPRDVPMETTYTNPLLLEFLSGMLVAKIVGYLQRIPLGIALCAFLAGALGDLLIDADGSPFRAVLWGVPSVLMVAAAVGLESRIGRRVGDRVLLLGNASYALYLVHTFIVPSVATFAGRYRQFGPWTFVILTAAASVVAGLAAHRYLEIPLNRHVKRWVDHLLQVPERQRRPKALPVEASAE